MTDEEQDSTGQVDPDGQDKSDGAASLPTLNFATFIFSLNSSALVQLGMIEDPMTGEKNKNLPLAKQTIDIISMLEEKTQGNLDADTSGAYFQFVPSGIAGIAPTPGCEGQPEGHFCAQTAPPAIEQRLEFLGSAAAGEVPNIISTLSP